MASILVALNYRGVKETAFLQNIIVLLLIGLIFVFIGVGVFHVDLANLQPFVTKGWGNVAIAVGTLYVSFIGFEVIASSAEEIKNPEKNLPLSMIASVLTPTAFYALVMFVSIGTLSTPILSQSQIPVADVAEIFLGPIGATAMIVGAIFATISSANASILSASRINFAMGKDRILSNWLNKVHKKYRTPYRSILVTGIVILALIAFGVGIDTLSRIAGFSYLVTYILVHISLIVMREADVSEYEPSFQIPLYPWVPITGIISSIAILAIMGTMVQAIGTGIVVIGIIWYFIYAKDKAPAEGAIKEALSTKEKEKPKEEKYTIVVPIANPETEIGLLKTANAVAKQKEDPEIVAINVLNVPTQLSPSQAQYFEEKRLENQSEILSKAKEIIEKETPVRTRGLISRSVPQAIIDVTKEEEADELIIGWEGRLSSRDYIFGSKIDVIVRNSPCEVSVIKVGPAKFQKIVTLVGEGPHTPFAIQKAYQLHKYNELSDLTLLNVQKRNEDSSKQIEKAKKIIKEAAEKAEITEDEYDIKIRISDNIERELLKQTELYDTVCIGGTRKESLQRTLFGALPEKIADNTKGSIVMTRKPYKRPLLTRIKDRFQKFIR